MKILIIGAAGMIGRKLAERLARDGTIGGKPVTQLLLADMVAPQMPPGAAAHTQCIVAELPGDAESLIAAKPDIIFHLAAIVSGEAEADLEKGYRVNFDGSRAVFEAIRKAAYRPRVVFASSIAVFGVPFPDPIPDDFCTAPLSSYGTQKAMTELLLADYSRRGFLDGIGLRLPTICVRPGLPNRAASSFFSGILREPLAGQEAVLPVSDTLRHWFASPRAAIGFLLHAATLDTAPLGARRSLNMPGLSATVGEQIEALRRVGGNAAVARIRRIDDPAVAKLVQSWPRDFDARRALALGFRAETSMDEILAVHLEDEHAKPAH